MLLGFYWLELLAIACVWCIWSSRFQLKLIWKLNGVNGLLTLPFWIFFPVLLLHPNRILPLTRVLKGYFKTPLAILFGPLHILYVDDPTSAEKILNSSLCLNKAFFADGIFANKGLLHTQGDKWKVRRKQLNPTFNYNVLMGYFPIYNEVGNNLQNKFNGYTGQQGYDTLEDIIGRAVLTAACRTTMGTEMNFLENDDLKIVQAYKKLLKISGYRSNIPWLQIDSLFRMTSMYKTFTKLEQMTKDFVNEIVTRKHREWTKTTEKEDIVEEENATEDENDEDVSGQRRNRIFIEQIFHLAEAGEITLKDIVGESNSMMVVAFETVSNSVTFAILNLAMDPDVQRKLRDEILDVFPDGDVSTISGQDLKNMNYLDMVINESLRVLTTVPLLVRNVEEDFYLKDDVVVPKGTTILLHTLNMHRDTNIWGPKANEFYPEHFLPENIARRHPYAFLPFLKGLRICIGWRYSVFLAKILLIKLLQAYRFTTDAKLKDFEFSQGITLRIKNCSKIRISIERLK